MADSFSAACDVMQVISLCVLICETAAWVLRRLAALVLIHLAACAMMRLAACAGVFGCLC